MGIGKKLIDITKEEALGQCMVLLLSVPEAMEYYPNAGMQKLKQLYSKALQITIKANTYQPEKTHKK